MTKSSKKPAEASTKKSNLMRTVLVILGSVVLSVGATLYLAAPHVLGQMNPFAESHAATSEPSAPPAAHETHETPPPAPVEVSAPVFLELEPFTSMLRDANNRRRVLYVGLTLRVSGEEDKVLLSEYMPEVRDRILRMLSLQDPAEVQPLEGRTRLAQELTSILSVPYHPRLPSPRITKVLFTAFVVH